MNSGFVPAKRLDSVRFSAVRTVLARATQLAAEGRRIIHFEIGEPDFDTPQVIVTQTQQALVRDRRTHYASNYGDLGLRGCIAERLQRKSGITVDPATEILVTAGSAEALFCAIMAVVDPGDEVILFSPAFLSYRNIVEMAGGVPVEIPLRPESGFAIDTGELRGRITPKTKLVVLNNPHNPSGVVFGKETLLEVGDIAREHDLLILSDEIYDDIVFEGEHCFSLASLDKLRGRVITVNGFSKAYAMTGWRLGYVAADKSILPSLLKVHQYCTNCVNTFVQAGMAASMLTAECLDDVARMCTIFERRRAVVFEHLAQIDGLWFVPGKGAYYVLANIASFGLADTEFAARLLEEKGVATVPGSGFGSDFTGHIRLSYALGEADIREGMALLAEFCRDISR